MTATKALQIMRRTALGLSIPLAAGLAFLELGPETGFRHQVQSVAATVIGPGILIGGPFNLVNKDGPSVTG